MHPPSALAGRSRRGKHAAMESRAQHPPFVWLGRQPYLPLWQQLQQRAGEIAAGTAPEIIWSCEHEPVYTTGQRAVDNRQAATLPAPLVVTDRGGETTFHGPGQLMLYPLLNLRERQIQVRHYVELLEASCIGLLADYGVTASRRCGLPGVWVGSRKIAAIGLRIKNGVAYHGMALNVSCDLAWFAAINPCGTGLPACRLQELTGTLPALECIAGEWQQHLQRLIA